MNKNNISSRCNNHKNAASLIFVRIAHKENIDSKNAHRTTFEKCATGRILLCCFVKMCQLFSKLSGGIFNVE